MSSEVVSPGAALTRERLLESAQQLFVLKGYALTSVDEICASAKTTKGAFFHHFRNKEDMALAALDRFAWGRFDLMRSREAEWPEDPIDRYLAYVQHVSRESVSRRQPRGCLIAILAMELGATSETFRAACDGYFRVWGQYVRGLAEEAIAATSEPVAVGANDLADYFIAVFEGSVVLARSSGDLRIFERNFGCYEAYLRAIFGRPQI